MPPILGAHVSIAGGLDRAVDRAVSAGCEMLQLFTKSSNQWAARPLADGEALAFQAKVDAAGLAAVVAHDSYLINVASADPALREKSIDALRHEAERCVTLGIPYLVMHPGAHTGAGEDEGIGRIAGALDAIHAALPGAPLMILLETVAGQGTTIGHTFEQLAAIIGRCADPDRLGVCFDTQHTFAAGYDLASDAGWDATWGAFDAALGLGRLKALHVNDSKKPLGSRVDRHEQIGEGLLGLATFWRLMNDPRLDGVPASLETEKTDDGFEDEQNLAVLRKLAGRARPPRTSEAVAWRARALEKARAAAARRAK